MHTSATIAGSLTAVGLATIAVLAGTNGSQTLAEPGRTSPAASQQLTLSSPWVGGRFHYLDLGRKGLGPGDVFTITGLPVHDEDTGRRVGATDGAETILSARHDGTVLQEMTYRFRGGTVTVAGALRHTDDPMRLPVTGGTGDYVGVTGQLEELFEDEDRKVSVFRLELHR
jgi:hypothetical protein